MTYKKQVGDYGENLVADLLRAKGYEIIARNYRKFFGEIDIVARNEELVAFVEVKTRKNKDFANPSEAVTFSKQAKLSRRVRPILWKMTSPILSFVLMWLR